MKQNKYTRKQVYARRDMRSSFGISFIVTNNGIRIPKYTILPETYKELSEKEKEKWAPIVVNRYTHKLMEL